MDSLWSSSSYSLPNQTAPSSHRLGMSCPLLGVKHPEGGLAVSLEASWPAISGPPRAHCAERWLRESASQQCSGSSIFGPLVVPVGQPKKIMRVRRGLSNFLLPTLLLVAKEQCIHISNYWATGPCKSWKKSGGGHPAIARHSPACHC